MNFPPAVPFFAAFPAPVVALAGGRPEGGEGPLPPVTEANGKITAGRHVLVPPDDAAIAAKGWKFRARSIAFEPVAVVAFPGHPRGDRRDEAWRGEDPRIRPFRPPRHGGRRGPLFRTG